MAMLDSDFLDICEMMGKQSYSKRNKVGCIITLGNRIISSGYNGTFKGRGNLCEDEFGNTLKEVIHAEENAILFALKNNALNLENAVLYTSLSPCFNCAKLIILSGIKIVFYRKAYRDAEPIEWLRSLGVRCIQVS